MQLTQALEGITYPLVTPLDGSDTLEETVLETLVDAVFEDGVDGRLPRLTTGEFVSLHSSRAEQ